MTGVNYRAKKMIIKPNELKRIASYALTIASVVPRPIAWVSSLNVTGIANLAPFSFFNAITNDPMTLMVSIGRRRGERKDTANNLLGLPEAVIHIPTTDLLKKMVLSSADFAEDIDETKICGLTMVDSTYVKPRRIASANIAMECKVVNHMLVGNEPNDVFFFEVICLHADDEILDKRNTPATKELSALGRLGHGDYTIVNKGVETLPRPRTADEALDGSWSVGK